MPITKEIAQKFSEEWEESWNSHDIQSILKHYAEDVVLISPIAEKLTGTPEVKGIDSVKNYFLKGLNAYPDLRFKVKDVLFGNNSIVVYYVNQKGIRAGEFMELNENGKIIRMHAHYSE